MREVRSQPASDLHENFITAGIAEGVIHLFEAVQIDEEDRHPMRSGESLIETPVEEVTIWEPGQRVASGEQDGPIDLTSPVPLKEPKQHQWQQEQKSDGGARGGEYCRVPQRQKKPVDQVRKPEWSPQGPNRKPEPVTVEKPR